MRLRRETVEHPFGTMKARMGATHFLTKTLPKVAAEMALSVLAVAGPALPTHLGSHRQRDAKLGCHHGGSARSPFQGLGDLSNSGSRLRHCLQLLHIRFGPLATNSLLSLSHFCSGFCKARLVRHDNGNRMTRRFACTIKLEPNEAFTQARNKLRRSGGAGTQCNLRERGCCSENIRVERKSKFELFSWRAQ